MRRFASAVALVATAGLSVAACGGSSTPAASGGGSGSTGNSGAAAFLSKANAVCKSANAQQKALKSPADNAPMSDFADYLGKFVSLAQNVYSQLQGVTPPASKQAAYTTYLSNFDSAISDAKKAQQAATANDKTGFESAVQTVSKDGDKLDSEAKALGLTDCANSGNSGSSGSTGTTTSG